MAGRAKNKLHQRKKQREDQPYEEHSEASEGAGTPSGPAPEDAPYCGPVPRICMDYFYVSSGGASKAGAKGLTTKEFQKRLKELGQSTEGQRNVLIKRYERHVSPEGQEEMGS